MPKVNSKPASKSKPKPKSLYDQLGVDKTASTDDIKRAYRKRAAKAHPDRGGDKAEFQQLVLAYEVLSEDQKRQRYDATGQVDSSGTPESSFLSIIQKELAKILVLVLQNGELDIVATLQSRLRMKQTEADDQMGRLQDACQKLRRQAEKVLRKTQGDNLLAKLILSPVLEMEQQIQVCQTEKGHLDEALKFILDYTCTVKSKAGRTPEELFRSWYGFGAFGPPPQGGPFSNSWGKPQ